MRVYLNGKQFGKTWASFTVFKAWLLDTYNLDTCLLITPNQCVDTTASLVAVSSDRRIDGVFTFGTPYN